jgi:hypothetical protein
METPLPQNNTPLPLIPSVHVLLQPYFLSFLDFPQLATLSCLNKEYYSALKQNELSLGYWHAMCTSLAAHCGLYLPKSIENSRDYFFNEIWILKKKWRLQEQQSQSFRIRIASRFRPGTLSQNRFALPLHQFLKVRANQAIQNKQQVFVGEKAPEHFQDALLGTLMKEPVRLPDSNQILDRSVAITCVLRGGKDPFTGTKLTQESLIPMPELGEEIALFRQRQQNIDISLSQNDVLELVDHVDPRLIEALVEAEQIRHASHRAHYEASYEDKYGISLSEIQRLENHFQDPIQQQIQLQEPADDEQPQTTHPHIPPEALLEAQLVLNQRQEDEENEEMSSRHATVGSFSSSSSRWSKAKSENSARIIDINKQTATVTMNVPGVGVRPYHFNAVFPQQESQEKIYHRSARDVVISAINGLNGCILCYGQTGSGKTHTMFGPEGALQSPIKSLQLPQDLSNGSSSALTLESLEEISNGKSQHGIVLRSCAEILRAKKQFELRDEITLEITVQYVEIYNEIVTDLISPAEPMPMETPPAAAAAVAPGGAPRVTIRRATGELVGATERTIHSLQDIFQILQHGNLKKHFAATAMNDHSSRSHTILLIHLTQHQHLSHSMLRSSLYLVDLAGSERVKKSGAQGQQLVEARAINSSLLVLGKVISRLSRSELHVPYYESQLTTLLKGSFGGNCKTRVIVTCRTDDQLHGEETLQTLRFAEKCSLISNSTKTVAAASVETVLQCLDHSIEEVRKQIESLRKKNKTHLPSFQSLEMKLSELRTKRESIAAMAVSSS